MSRIQQQIYCKVKCKVSTNQVFDLANNIALSNQSYQSLKGYIYHSKTINIALRSQAYQRFYRDV